MQSPSRRTFALLVGLLALASCRTVEYYEKEALARPTMAFAETPAELHFQAKVTYSDEGAVGGIGTSGGGGCGCY